MKLNIRFLTTAWHAGTLMFANIILASCNFGKPSNILIIQTTLRLFFLYHNVVPPVLGSVGQYHMTFKGHWAHPMDAACSSRRPISIVYFNSLLYVV